MNHLVSAKSIQRAPALPNTRTEFGIVFASLINKVISLFQSQFLSHALQPYKKTTTHIDPIRTVRFKLIFTDCNLSKPSRMNQARNIQKPMEEWNIKRSPMVAPISINTLPIINKKAMYTPKAKPKTCFFKIKR